MPDVLRMSTLQVGDPVTFVVLMKGHDPPFHSEVARAHRMLPGHPRERLHASRAATVSAPARGSA